MKNHENPHYLLWLLDESALGLIYSSNYGNMTLDILKALDIDLADEKYLPLLPPIINQVCIHRSNHAGAISKIIYHKETYLEVSDIIKKYINLHEVEKILIGWYDDNNSKD